MKLTLFRIGLISILIIVASNAFSQAVHDSIYYKRLYFLCKVWGHAKYYHSEIAAGTIDWDVELLKAAKGVKNAPSNEAFNDTIMLMLVNAGEMGISTVTIPEFPDSLNNNLDYSWMYDDIFNSSVRAELDTIRVRFRPQSNVYLDQGTAHNPIFENDQLYYSTFSYPREEIRLLSLFRFWNIIHYFFPYKYMMDQDWETNLKEFIPQVVEAQDGLEFHLAIKELSTRINDTHGFFGSAVYGEWEGEYHPPFLVRTIENEVVVTKVAPNVTEVKKGDVIRKIDGIDIIHAKDSVRKYAHGSNEVMVDFYTNQILLWGDVGNFEISIDNGDEVQTLTLSRSGSYFYQLHNSNYSHPVWRDTIIDDSCKFGIVDMGQLEPEDIEEMFTDLWDAQTIVFDIRNYPNGTLWYLVDYIFKEPIHIASFTYPDTTYPGRLKWHYETIGNGTSDPYMGNIIMLFDERTISQAEYTCMGLEQFPEAIKIGSTTAGADGNVSNIYLTGKISIGMTGLGTFYPDFTETQRVGIIPDYEIRPTIEGIREGKDEVMDFALNCALFGVEENYNSESINIYPNPVNSSLKYQFTDIHSSEICFVEVIDLLGKTIIKKENIDNEGMLDLSGLKNGIYIVKFVAGKRIVSKKIIKQ